MTTYPTTYIDKFGKEDTSFESDGMSLTIRLRNHTFIGQNFDCLEMQAVDLIGSKNNFSLNEYDSLTDCLFKIRIPIKLKNITMVLNSILDIEVVLEKSKHPMTRMFTLTVDKQIFDIQKDGESGMWFESQMIRLQKLLPKTLKINSCIFCAYSNYWVGGSDSFGTLLCFKKIKDKIVNVKDKGEYMDAALNNWISTQETFWCSEFMDIGEDQWQYKDPT